MNIKDINITLRQALVAGGFLLTASGAYYSLQAQVNENEKEITRVEKRTLGDSTRIRSIENKAAAAEAERKAIKEQAEKNGRKLDAILLELRQSLRPTDQ